MLQKKFEKLPGLSNVSGKYTKKTTTDVYSRPSVLDNRCTTTHFQGLSAQESPTASTPVLKFEPDERHRYRFGSTAVPSSCSVPQLKDTVNRQVDRRRSHIQVLSTRQSSTDVSSPSWPSSLSSVSNDRQFPSSNLPTRTSENLRRVKKASEIIKSSSSGSVASLTHKPTGIILGTSSTVHGSETTGSLSNTHVTRPHAPSTPYPVRQFCMSSANRDGVGPSSSSSSPLQHSIEKPAESMDSSEASTNAVEPIRCTRPSVLVRPMNMPVQVSSSLGVACPPDATSSYAGISFDRNARVPWKRHVYADSETRRRVCSPSSSQVATSQLHGPRSTHDEPNSVVSDRIQSTGLVSSRSVSGVPWLFSTTSALGAYQGQDFRISNDINSDSDHTSVSSNWSHTTHRSSGPACPQCRFSVAPQSFCSHFYELQSPHPPWGSAFGGHPDGVAMPGPQYTQCALQQYLSDLIAGESSLLGESTKCSDRDDNSLDKNSTGVSVPFFESMSNNSDSQGLELLRCLENRIQNALRNLYNSGVPVGTFENANLSARGSRGRSISFSSGSQRYAFPSGATTMHSLVTSPAYDSPTPEKSSQPGISLTGAKVQVTSQLSQELTDRRSMLDQFSENELRYLLKAVHDLLALRSRTCGTPGSFSSSPSPVILQHRPKPTPPKTDREETVADGSYRHVSKECLLDSQATSRSSSTVRTSCIRALKSGLDRPPSSSDATTASTPGSEYDSSSSDLMHKRLPLGFQHFKRYLDNKFGPDQPHPLSPSFSIRTTISGSGHLAEATVGVRGATASVEQPTPFHTSHSTSTNSIAVGEVQPRPLNAEPSVTNCRPPTGSDAASHVTQSTNCLVSSRGSLGETHRTSTCRNAPCLDSSINTTEHSRNKAPLPVPDDVDHLCQLAAVELGHNSTEVHAFPTSPYIAPITPVNVNSGGTAPVLQYYEERDYPPPQQFDLSPPLVPHTPYLPFHQRSCGSNPEVTETHASNFPIDYSARSRWSPYVPQCYWWPHPAADHSPHNSWLSQFVQEQLNMTIPQFPTPQETCSCGIEFHQMYPYTHWHRPQLSAVSGGSALRGCENARFAAYADSARVMPSSSTAMQLNSVVAFPSGQSVDATYSGGYGFPDSAQMATAQWEYPSYVDRAPFMHHGPPRTFYPLSPSPTFDSAMWNSPVAWSSRLPYCHTPFSPYHFRMPRSGSAGAGFGCSLDGSSNPTGLMSQRMTRERSVGPDLNGLQPPIPRSAHRCLGPMYHAPPNLPMGRGTSDLSPPAKDSPNVTPGGVRTMSNSLSANDLSGYRSKHPFEMRSTKSSFELSPELPCDPALTLTNFTDFYSKIAAFIEMDNSLQIAVPSGWSERRSTFGRCYYACDQTKQASWNHPTLGLYVPLGWERVDSCHDGIFYRNLLIPHCQRHHPNLWLPAPMKDPAVEREGFFSDLRHLQSSVRHEIKFEFRELEPYKNVTTVEEEKTFLTLFNQLDVGLMVEVTRALDQLFYKDLHALVVFFEQERLRIASALFTVQHMDEF
ncbi:hypothetical protein CRM22_001059 [Opisthorchis felineus]|uniref:WW domain-containing protein n=1 Tax=Opisthorchis felineus TaxID=147828 RepID=A0A4S2MGJ8_OPIFE|nr:hypothetical protein CRM22_001059 [Opisthorchis felineus]